MRNTHTFFLNRDFPTKFLKMNAIKKEKQVLTKNINVAVSVDENELLERALLDYREKVKMRVTMRMFLNMLLVTHPIIEETI